MIKLSTGETQSTLLLPLTQIWILCNLLRWTDSTVSEGISEQ